MIVPAILANTEKDVTQLLDISKKSFPFVQLDIMDGQLVPSKSVGGTFFSTYDFGALKLEVHLMVRDPKAWIPFFTSANITTLIFHLEILQYYPQTFVYELIDLIKKQGKKAGIAINPPTPLETLEPFIKKIDQALFMCVNPGFYGAPFIEEALDKIRLCRKMHASLHISVDGGVKSANFEKIVSTGVDTVCIGSAIFSTPDPKASFAEFNKRFEKLRAKI